MKNMFAMFNIPGLRSAGLRESAQNYVLCSRNHIYLFINIFVTVLKTFFFFNCINLSEIK